MHTLFHLVCYCLFVAITWHLHLRQRGRGIGVCVSQNVRGWLTSAIVAGGYRGASLPKEVLVPQLILKIHYIKGRFCSISQFSCTIQNWPLLPDPTAKISRIIKLNVKLLVLLESRTRCVHFILCKWCWNVNVLQQKCRYVSQYVSRSPIWLIAGIDLCIRKQADSRFILVSKQLWFVLFFAFFYCCVRSYLIFCYVSGRDLFIMTCIKRHFIW